ncbi:helix-turn-helix transcriptional regulator [Nonomuraea sp. NPDC049725]|uniref:helix-turn-helix transcriptional regulator n=1 Tax=Nonomuraea sp. NPDC049725 TaxID=3154508 RepID=UPI00342401C4
MYAERGPEPALADRVACLWRQVSDDDRAQLVVPDGCVDLIWGPRGPFVAGPDTRPAPVAMRAGDRFAGVRFKPGAAGDVFGVPLSELRDQRVPAAALDALAGLPADPPDDPLRALLAVVETRLRRTAAPDPSVTAIAARLRTGRTVAETAWDLGLSVRQLHRRSLTSFGYAPKTLQRVVRFQRALRLTRAGVPLADVAARAGYADQAHLANDVKRLSGVTLRRLVPTG